MNETTLRVRKALDGDAGSLDWVTQRFTPLLLTYARTRMAIADLIEPEDLVADAWLRFVQRKDELNWNEAERFTPRLIGWMRRTMAWISTELRKQADKSPKTTSLRVARGEEAGTPEPAADWTTASRKAARSEVGAKILERLTEIGDRETEVFLRRVIDEQSWAEIGDALGEKANTCAVGFYRTIEELRGLFPPDVVRDWQALI